MYESQPRSYRLMIGLSLIFTVLAVVTLLPNSGASKPNVLGYRSVCTFAPAATALCALLAGITCTIRNRRVSVRAASTRYRPPFIPVLTAVVLITAAIVFGVRFVGLQSEFIAIIGNAPIGSSSLRDMKDGTWTGAVDRDEVTAAVVIEVRSGRIDAIRLENGRNIEASVADQIFRAVTAAQSTEVDAVSGATASSAVLLEAIGAAAAEASR